MTSSLAPSLSPSDLAMVPLSTPRPQTGTARGQRCRSNPASPSGRALAQRNRRVMTYRQLVRPLAVHYALQCQESCEDLIQVGLLGLIRAAELYDGKRQTPFEAFARPHIRGAILHYLRDAAPSVRLPRRQAELQSRLRRLQETVRPRPEEKNIAGLLRQALGLNQHQWDLLEQQRQLSRPCSLTSDLVEQLSERASLSGGNGSDWSADGEAGDAYLDIAAGGAMGAEAMLSLLDPQQRLVVRQVVLAGWSYRKLGQQLQVSPMTVQRQLRRGLARLREELDGLRSARSGFSPGPGNGPVPSAVPGC